MGSLLAGRQSLHQTHLHRDRGETRTASTQTDACWFPPPDSASSGLQPSLGVSRAGKAMIFVIIGPVGPYFATGSFSPVSLLADPAFVRAWQGGVGSFKMGG